MIERITRNTAIWFIFPVFFIIVSCDGRDIPFDGRPEPETDIKLEVPAIVHDDPLWHRHHDTPIRILAIGNSYALNATAFLPYMFDALNSDSICVAVLSHPGCSLRRHWANHEGDLEEYELLYSDGGEWRESMVKTIDGAITMLDWDIISLQQDSGNSGFYSTYQPHLENLTGLIRATDPKAELAWHVTWPYTPDCLYVEFSRYDHDWIKMYDAIIESAIKASEWCDMTINSASLIRWMREEFPDVTDGFSADGRHVSDPTAQYALSVLWYETLVGPRAGTSVLNAGIEPDGVECDVVCRTDSVIMEILRNPLEWDSNSVPMIRE